MTRIPIIHTTSHSRLPRVLSRGGLRSAWHEVVNSECLVNSEYPKAFWPLSLGCNQDTAKFQPHVSSKSSESCWTFSIDMDSLVPMGFFDLLSRTSQDCLRYGMCSAHWLKATHWGQSSAVMDNISKGRCTCKPSCSAVRTSRMYHKSRLCVVYCIFTLSS